MSHAGFLLVGHIELLSDWLTLAAKCRHQGGPPFWKYTCYVISGVPEPVFWCLLLSMMNFFLEDESGQFTSNNELNGRNNSKKVENIRLFTRHLSKISWASIVRAGGAKNTAISCLETAKIRYIWHENMPFRTFKNKPQKKPTGKKKPHNKPTSHGRFLQATALENKPRLALNKPPWPHWRVEKPWHELKSRGTSCFWVRVARLARVLKLLPNYLLALA